MDLCKDGKLVTISEDVTVDSNNITHIHRLQRCVIDPQPIPIEWIIGIAVTFGLFFGLYLACCICHRRSRVHAVVHPADSGSDTLPSELVS